MLASPPPHASDAIIAEQEAWAAQSDKKTSEFLANLTARGGKAIGNAGESCLRGQSCRLCAVLARKIHSFARLTVNGHSHLDACVCRIAFVCRMYGDAHMPQESWSVLCCVCGDAPTPERQSLRASGAYSFRFKVL